MGKLPYNPAMPQLFIVATPLGNLGDITLRAIETLRSVDLIAAEDTRHSLGLLNHLEIRKPLISCHGHNEDKAAQRVVAALREGKSAAFISDAGTPGISDPGARLVRRVRDAGFGVSPVPGPSAMTALASVAGASGRRLVFDGFLSPKSGRRKKQLKEVLDLGDNCIVYESPFRIVKLLDDLAALAPERRIVVGRELTKLHEEILEGTPGQLAAEFSARPAIKGEFAVFICGSSIDDSDQGETKVLTFP